MHSFKDPGQPQVLDVQEALCCFIDTLGVTNILYTNRTPYHMTPVLPADAGMVFSYRHKMVAVCLYRHNG